VKLSQLHRECFEKRTALTNTIQGLPHPKGVDALAEITYATQIAYDLTYDEAHVRGQEILAARRPDFTGTRPVCILSWSFEDESLWRGLSDNRKSFGWLAAWSPLATARTSRSILAHLTKVLQMGSWLVSFSSATGRLVA
jgi:hypothetical protein